MGCCSIPTNERHSLGLYTSSSSLVIQEIRLCRKEGPQKEFQSNKNRWKENSEQICVLQAGQQDTLGNMKFQSSDIEALEILFISSIPPSHLNYQERFHPNPTNRSFEPHSPFSTPSIYFFSLGALILEFLGFINCVRIGGLLTDYNPDCSALVL